MKIIRSTCTKDHDGTARAYKAYVAEEAAHHDRAPEAAQSVEKGTKTLLADSQVPSRLNSAFSQAAHRCRCTLEPRTID